MAHAENDWLLLCSGSDFKACGVRTQLRLEEMKALHRKGVLPSHGIQAIKRYGSRIHNTMWLGTFLWIRSDLAADLESHGVDLALKAVFLENSMRGVDHVYYPVVDKTAGGISIQALDANKEIVYLKTKGYDPHVRGVTLSGDFSLPGMVAYDADGRTGLIAVRRAAAIALKACHASNISLFEPDTYLFRTSRAPVINDQNVPTGHCILDYERAFAELDLARPGRAL